MAFKYYGTMAHGTAMSIATSLILLKSLSKLALSGSYLISRYAISQVLPDSPFRSTSTSGALISEDIRKHQDAPLHVLTRVIFVPYMAHTEPLRINVGTLDLCLKPDSILPEHRAQRARSSVPVGGRLHCISLRRANILRREPHSLASRL